MMHRCLAGCGLLLLLLAGCADTDTAPGDADTSYADQMAQQHAGDEPTPTTMVQEPIIPVTGEMVTYGEAGGQTLRGYVAQPTRPDSVAESLGLPSRDALPSIIVVHEWWGLNENIQAMTRRLAGEGFRALAVDLYNGQVAQQPDQARQYMQQATENQEQIQNNIRQAYQYLTQEVGAPEVAIIGWCFGGGVTMNAALALNDSLDAAVIYYGQPVTDRAQLQQLNVPILGIFGGQDQSIPVEQVRQFEEAITASNDAAEVYIYDDAGHAFANPSGQNYVEEAATDAWDKTMRFLREHLFQG